MKKWAKKTPSVFCGFEVKKMRNKHIFKFKPSKRRM
jgi:hypothetical protein